MTSPNRASKSSRRTRKPRAAPAGTTSPRGPLPTANSAMTRPRTRSSSGSSTPTCPVLDTGARGSTTTFAQRGIGDVLLAWENEAFLAIDELGADKFEIVVPSLSIKAEPPVAIVDKVVDAKGTRKVAEAYLEVPLYAGSAEADRQALLSSLRPERGRSEGSRPLHRREARVDRRSALRRMGQGTAEALR